MSRLLKVAFRKLSNSNILFNIHVTLKRGLSKKTMVLEKLRQDARFIFLSGVNAVKPKNLISSCVKRSGSTLSINGNINRLSQRVYVVGFGKAVSGMATALEDILGDNLTSGIISVPIGTSEVYKTTDHQSILPRVEGKIKMLEGAKNNLPDENSLKATEAIVELVTKLDKEDLLIVLISGGGSALLPYPKPPLSLAEKTAIIKVLSNNGATIQELNSVRKRLSLVKGGGLAQMAYPSKIISLILSDIIGDPLDLIASSPTVENKDDPEKAMTILETFLKPEGMSLNIKKALSKSSLETENGFDHVTNYLIGTNQKALEGAKSYAENIGYVAIIITNTLHGEASSIGRSFARLANDILDTTQRTPISKENCEDYKKLFGAESINIIENASEVLRSKNPLCLLFGGESTVIVKKSGKGGRNQEMSLSFAIESERLLNSDHSISVLLLSAGTDGIDGPTDAAGALAYPTLASEARSANIDPEYFLLNNDSYSFYKKFRQGLDHVVIGHTGTNVMDIQILLIHPKLQ